MQDLGTLGGTASSAAGINNNGQVAGNSALSDGTIHPFIWTATSGMVDLGLPRAASFSAVAINALGHVVGNGADADGNQFAYLWTPERGFVRVGAEPGGHNVANGLNDFDEVTGVTYTTIGSQAFLWSPSHPQVRHLGVYPGGSFSQGFAINNLHHIACFGDTHPLAGPDNAPFYFVLQYAKASGWKLIGGIDFGTFPAGSNDHDTIVGHTSDTFALDKAVDFIDGGSLIVLPPLNGYNQAHATAVNESNVVVGFSFYTGGPTRAVIWPNTAMGQDLGTLGGASSYAAAINDLGQVVGVSDIP